MSNNENHIAEREAVEALLPWYESGQLDAEDTKRVEAYLSAHPDIASQLALVEEERIEAVQMNEARGTPAAGALDRLMETIDEHTAEERVHGSNRDYLLQNDAVLDRARGIGKAEFTFSAILAPLCVNRRVVSQTSLKSPCYADVAIRKKRRSCGCREGGPIVI